MVTSSQPLKVPLRNQTFHIALPDVELAILGQINSTDGVISSAHATTMQKIKWGTRECGLPVFSLDFPRVFEYPDVNEEVSRWFEASS